jgi:hypothetical protein
MATFRKALKLAGGDHITLGGGEPTMHPRFWEILGLCMGAVEGGDSGLWLATNGSITETAIALANMAKRGVLGVALSQDPWHSPIDPRVVEAFTKGKKDRLAYGLENTDFREIRDVSRNVETMAPWRGDEDNGGSKWECCCDDTLIDPDGKVWACGCKSLQLGTVDGYELPEGWEDQDTRCGYQYQINTQEEKCEQTA